ncbi:unnamed protein product [Adineta ricciae]|uniref:Molybdate-anion transporter n=1 Tax=Adineta ricciae TaxID=249248 RepID=A0A815MBN6_ADIRI|nr:unnamed protein product [Adineta ricciae]
MITDGHEKPTMSSPFSRKLQSNYLIGFLLLSIGGYLPSAYNYVLFRGYGIDHSTIEHFFIYCFVGSLFGGTFVASLADHCGRRNACLLCSVIYGLYHASCNSSNEWILIIGHIFRGIGDALYSTAFEAWLMQEHEQSDLDICVLERILYNSNVYLNIVTIGTGFLAQLLSESYGYIAPFNVGIGFFAISFVFILIKWSENYGRKKVFVHTTHVPAMRILRTNPRIVLCGLANALFRASFYIWLIEWTPALHAATEKIFAEPLPLGFMYSCYLLSRLLGSFAFGSLIKRFRTQTFMIVIFLLAAIGLSVPVITPNDQLMILLGFLLLQICEGIFVPSIALLRSEYIPNEFLSTNYIDELSACTSTYTNACCFAWTLSVNYCLYVVCIYVIIGHVNYDDITKALNY